MKLKSYRYKHELTCKGKLEDIPRKPKAMPKTKGTTHRTRRGRRSNTTTETKIDATCFSNQILKPQTPNLVDASADASRGIRDFASHYQLLQNQFMQQKKEKYNNLCQNMFSSKSKKR